MRERPPKDTRCYGLLYPMRDNLRRDYGQPAAEHFATVNHIPARGGHCTCERCNRWWDWLIVDEFRETTVVAGSPLPENT